MKFGSIIAELEQKDDRFGYQYLNYNVLKAHLKEPDSPNKEKEFVKMLTSELDRVRQIISCKLGELKAVIRGLQIISHREGGNGNFSKLVIQADSLACDMIALERYVHCNSEGFRKIIKKHDRWSDVKTVWYEALGHPEFFAMSLADLNKMLLELSDVYQLIRDSQSRENENEKADGVDNETFERKSTKYWVKKEDLFALKAQIVKHIPLHIFNDKRNTKAHTMQRRATDILLSEATDRSNNTSLVTGWISSVYLDNENLDCYHKRMRLDEGATLTRVRWYGGAEEEQEGASTDKTVFPKPPKELFMERKKHHESWVIGNSLKERFQIQSKDVLAYLKGNAKADDIVKGAKGLELAKEIQDETLTRSLVPMIRSIYKRTAFQLRSSNDVRITIDSNLTFVNDSPAFRYETEWMRNDHEGFLEGLDWLPFKFCILEVKLKVSTPTWLNNILESDLVRQVHKFSKFQQACAGFFPSKVKEFPYWFGQADINNAYALQASRNHSKRGHKNLAFEGDNITSTEPDRPLKAGSTANSNDVVIAIGGSEKTNSSLLPSFKLSKSFFGTKESMLLQEKKTTKTATRRVKVEPKTYFANERTFIQWLTASLLLVTLGGALLNLGDETALWTGLVIMPMAVLILLYAIVTFYLRLYRIKRGSKSGYDDPIGPGLLSLALCVAVAATVGLHFRGHFFVGTSSSQLFESPTCHRIPAKLPQFFEPSDLAFDTTSETLWTCSGSKIANTDPKTGDIKLYRIDQQGEILDFEAMSFGSDHNVMYLGTEKQKNQILEYNLLNKTVTKVFDITKITGTSKPVLEGLSIVPDPVNPSDDLFFIGTDTHVIGFTVKFHEQNSSNSESNVLFDVIHRKKTGAKVGALTVYGGYLWALLDNGEKLILWDLNSPKHYVHKLPGSSKQFEGIAVAPSIDQKTLYVYLAKDTPAEIWKFEFDYQLGFTAC